MVKGARAMGSVNQTVFARGKRVALVAGAVVLSMVASACAKKSTNFSLLPDANQFKQNGAVIHGKIDVLWVIDNSGSMKASQQALADNFSRFIEKFNAKKYDYRLAVTTTDAYRVLFKGAPTFAQFRDGTDLTSHTGVRIVTPDTANLVPTFMTNVLQGTNGVGDERAFQSFREALKSPLNAEHGFPRPDAFLAVIIVSDEDDFSHDTSQFRDGQYDYAGLHTVQSYVDYLDGVMGANDGNRSTKYNVNTIGVLDADCKAILESGENAKTGLKKIGKRYIELSEKTNGVVGDICGDFGSTLSNISNTIIQRTSQFYLDRQPDPSTVAVTIDGVNVPRLPEDAPEPRNGFIYHPDTNSVTFHGDFEPAVGATINVNFDPLTLK